jgi:hypothetical protein
MASAAMKPAPTVTATSTMEATATARKPSAYRSA